MVWIHDGAHATARAVTRAIAEREAAGDARPIRVVVAPDRYLSGEATGIIRTLEGGPTLPRFVRDPARPWSDGHRPVLVQNTETMARVGVLALGGAARYRPTSLLTIVSPDHRIVAEVGPEMTFSDVIGQYWASPDGREPQAVLLGGYGGSWIDWADVRDIPVDLDALRAQRLSLGAGLVGALPVSACGIEETARIVRYMAGQSARQCGPCVFGLASVAELVSDLTAGKLGASGKKRLHTFMDEINGRGACRHPDGVLRMLGSALTVFAADLHLHRRGRSCAAPLHSIFPVPEEVQE